MHENYVCMEWLLSGNVFSECDLILRTFVIFIHFKCYYSTTHKSDSFQVIRKEHHFWELQSSQFVLTVKYAADIFPVVLGFFAIF